MKKQLLAIIMIIIALASVVLLASCGDENNPEQQPKPVYSVALMGVHYGLISTIKVTEGDTIASQLNSSLKRYAWYTSKYGDIEWNIYKDVVTCDMTLFARESE